MQKGSIVYMRVYSGCVNNRASFYNTTRGITEKPAHVFRVRANHYVSKYMQLTENSNSFI